MGPKHLKILAGIALFLGSLSLPAGAQQSSLVPSATTPGHLRWFPETQVQWTPLRDGETLNEIKQHFTINFRIKIFFTLKIILKICLWNIRSIGTVLMGCSWRTKVLTDLKIAYPSLWRLWPMLYSSLFQIRWGNYLIDN